MSESFLITVSVWYRSKQDFAMLMKSIHRLFIRKELTEMSWSSTPTNSAHRFGSFAEYALAKENNIYFKPVNLSFQQTAALPCAGDTALQAVRKAGKVQKGERVLVIGASGGVGHFLVQIAKADGAHVTGVCSGRNVEMVRGLGADEVIDYNQTDYSKTGQKWDVILDAAASKSLWTMAGLLNPKGRYVNVGGDTLMHTLLWGAIVSAWTRKSLAMFMVAPGQQDMIQLKELCEAGKVVPHIESVVPFSKLPEAIMHLETKRARGKTVIDVLSQE